MTGPKPSGPPRPTPSHPPKLAVPAGPVLDEADRILAAEIELHHTGIGEPNEYSTPPAPCRQATGWKGEGPGTCGVECECGLVYDGLDTLAEAIDLLDRHIDPPPAASDPRLRPVSPLPRLGEQVRDVERLLAQALAVLARPVDPASEPTTLAYPVLSDDARVHDVLLGHVVAGVKYALRKLGRIAELPMPAVGSAVKPARPLPGEEPTPGSAAVLRGAARESTGPVDGGPGAGASPDPSPSVTPVAPGRGVGPGVIGPETPGQAAFAKAVSDAMAREARRPR